MVVSRANRVEPLGKRALPGWSSKGSLEVNWHLSRMGVAQKVWQRTQVMEQPGVRKTPPFSFISSGFLMQNNFLIPGSPIGSRPQNQLFAFLVCLKNTGLGLFDCWFLVDSGQRLPHVATPSPNPHAFWDDDFPTIIIASPQGNSPLSWFSPPARWGLLDFVRDVLVLLLLLIPVGTIGPQPRELDRSDHHGTSTASARSLWAPPDLNEYMSVKLSEYVPKRMSEYISIECRKRFHIEC